MENLQNPGVKVLWKISYPLMLTALSGNLMLFVDKILISKYDPVAMAAVATVGMVFAIFQFGAVSVASIAEVFVGKYNGALQHYKIGPVIWQMIWFSFLTAIIFIPVGLYCGDLFLPVAYQDFGVPYFKVIMVFGFTFPLIAALSSFSIGLGNVRLITISTILANMINVILDVVLIFGVEPYILPMGTSGAAIATGTSMLLQAVLLFAYFLQQKYRSAYKTSNFKLSIVVLKECLNVGVPNAMGYFFEIAAWAFLLQIAAYHGSEHLIVLTAGQTIFLLLAFTTDGLQKSIIVIASNIIGAKKLELMPGVVKSAFKLHLIMVLCFSIPMILCPQYIIYFFISENPESLNNDILFKYATSTCLYVLIYFVFDGLVWIFGGILIAYLDTRFVMIMNAASVWLAAVLPAYLSISFLNSSPNIIWQCMIFYAFINALGFYLRYYKKTQQCL